MKNIQNLTIDINKKPFQKITANVGEVASRFIKITILDGNVPVDLTGVNVSLYAEKPDSKKVFNNVTIEDEKNGVVLAGLTSQILAIEGTVALTLLLVKNNAKLYSKQFLLNVDKSIIDDNAIESTNEFGALTTSLSKLAEWDIYFKETSGQIEEKYTTRLNNIENKADGIVSVKNFGAKGDGVTDDTQAFQNTIDYAISNNSKTIYVPSGNYLITSSLEINGGPNSWDLIMKGSGKGIDGRGTCLKYTGGGNLLNIDLTYNVGGWRGIYFYNMTFRGNNKSNNGLYLNFCQQAKFDNVYFTGFKSAVKLTGNSHYPNFINCNFSSNDIGIHILNECDQGFVPGNSNNGKVDNCFFTYCLNPILQGDGAEWTIINTDFEGYNGAIVLKDSNRMINCRVERNNDNDNWIRILGDNNQLDINIHGAGSSSSKIEYRILVLGSNNIIKGSFGYLIYAICDLGDNNTFYINTKNGGYTSPSMYVLRPNSFIFNNRDTDYNKNLIATMGERGANQGDEVVHSIYNTKHKLVKKADSSSICRYTYSTNTFADVKTLYAGCDIYIKDNNDKGFEVNIFGGQLVIPQSNKWVSVITVKSSNQLSNTVTVTGVTPGYYFTIANPYISDYHPTVNYVKFATETTLTPSNFRNNVFEIDTLDGKGVCTLELSELGNSKIKYKNRLFKYNNGLVDMEDNRIKYSTTSVGAIPSSSLSVRIEGKGKGRFLDCFLSREDISSNFTVTNKTAIGCDVTFANSAGTLGGTALDNMEFFITTLK